MFPILLLNLFLATPPAEAELAAITDKTGKSIDLIAFQSRRAVPGFNPSDETREFYERFGHLLATLPEAQSAQLGLALAQTLGQLTAPQKHRISGQLDTVYRRMSADPLWADAPSTLPYCFESDPRMEGQYLLVRPEIIDSTTPIIVFLHGYGGNFLSNAFLIAEAIPDAVLIAPSWPESWADGQSWYAEQALDHALASLNIAPDQVYLMGLSDGGKALTPIALRKLDRYAGIISIAMTLPQKDVNRLPRDTRIFMACGTLDKRVAIESARKQAETLRRRYDHVVYVEVEGDHFFLLEPDTDVFDELKRFVNEDHPTPDAP